MSHRARIAGIDVKYGSRGGDGALHDCIVEVLIVPPIIIIQISTSYNIIVIK